MTKICVIIGRKGNLLYDLIELERKIDKKMTLPTKILLTSTGALEYTLSIMVKSELKVKILRQEEIYDRIQRTALILRKKNGTVLVRADSSIYTNSLPYGVVNQLRKKQQSIGEIIA